MSEMISRKDAISAIMDVQSRPDAIVFGNSIHRAPVSVQEAAKVLLENISTEGGTGPVYAAFCDLFGSDVDDVDSALRAIAEGGEA